MSFSTSTREYSVIRPSVVSSWLGLAMARCRQSVRTIATVAVAMVLMGLPCRVSAGPVTTDSAIDKAADQIAQALRDRSVALAVPDIPALDGRVTVLGRYVAEELVTGLFERGMQVVERSLLDHALSELKLGTTDLMDPAAVKRFGRLVGAQGIIVGTLTDLGDTVKLNLRVVDVETGMVIGAAASVLQKDGSVARMLSQAVTPRWVERPAAPP